ncbi:MAG: leucyl aminopeptidase family protein [Sphaerospermopsis sp. SIO1G2]|nr:leucyl aminopeptidase family protein [Sphaerospermopsis sp. SIO1G2]
MHVATIPIHLTCAENLYDTALSVGGEALKQWCMTHYKGEHHTLPFILWPDKEGKLACALAIIDPPYTPYSCAQLASSLPEGSYHFVFDYVDDEVETRHHADFALGWMMEQYRFSTYKADDNILPELIVPQMVLNRARADYNAIKLVRNLINTPPADMGPEELGDAAIRLARQYKAKCQIIEGRRLQSDYPAIHAVGKGSPRAPRLIDMHWGDVKDAPKVTLVGKGVCFDTGGLNLKSSAGIKLMKKDMGGAACVLGLAQRIMEAELPITLRVLIPAVENSVDGASYRPSDVLIMRNGKTVEVGDTDAEGRLVLADALSEACEDTPDLLIDCATLTGAARVALGTELPALFCNNSESAQSLCAISNTVHDPLWHMPLHEAYASHLDSPIADMSNIGHSSYGGAITAALFLQRFVSPAVTWCHIDMMAWNMTARPGRPKGGEAMGLRALFAWLQSRYGAGNSAS